MRLLLIEDEKMIGLPLKKALERHLYAVDYFTNGQDGFDEACLNNYDCIILDINLPDMNGMEIAKSLRQNSILTSILMLSARTEQEDILEGFENGADDYLRKPFHFQELLYRINSLVKRSSHLKEEVISVDGIELNTGLKKVLKHSQEVKLNAKEYGILEYLLRNQGRVVSQEELLEHVWDREIDSFTQTIRTNVKTLRQKIDPNKQIIKTIKGSGYLIDEN
ncbi:MAG: response regulator transcription factor [Candidatus Saccharibacteria bacterium]